MKHVPMRTCIQSREKLPKDQLVRFVIDPDSGKFSLDEKGKIRARGANLKPDLKVYDKAVDSGAFERALNSKIEEDQYDETRTQLEKHIKREDFRKGRDKVSVRVKGESIKLD